MTYKVIGNYIKENSSWVGCLVIDQEGKQYLTSGVYIWEATQERLNKVKLVDTINKNEFLEIWNKYQGYNKIQFQ